jgi:hypothetical protein
MLYCEDCKGLRAVFMEGSTDVIKCAVCKSMNVIQPPTPALARQAEFEEWEASEARKNAHPVNIYWKEACPVCGAHRGRDEARCICGTDLTSAQITLKMA